MLILGIESSCDETAASLLKDGAIIENIVLSQSVHTKLGGVVPSLASKDHEKNILDVVKSCFKNNKYSIYDLDAISVTYGPGLLGSLIVGLNFAKGLSLSLNKPLIAVSHLEGHLYSSFIDRKQDFPFISLIVSGGHTQILLVEKFEKYHIIANTVDDAAGEAFDKGAKILGLNYPGGPEIEKKSKFGNDSKFEFPIPEVKNNKFNFSFSGLKTALLYKKKYLDENKIQYSINDLAASYQKAIVLSLINKLQRTIEKYKIFNITIVGGVSANMYFREKTDNLKNKYNLNIDFPDLKYCTDNAAMIAMVGYYKYINNKFSNINIEPNPNLKL